MTVSVAIIARNEERVLGRCLESLHKAVDEIVVVDTGSDDATRQIAGEFGARVFEFPWVDDFAAARQFAFDQATSEWVCWVDADDVVLGAEHLRRLSGEAPDGVIGFYWRYVLGRDASGEPTFEFWRERCVRNDGSFRWAGRVHEVLVAQRPGETVRTDDIIVEHHPDPERSPAKRGRNLRILEAEYEERDGQLEPRMLFYLGREYADHGENERAITILRQYLMVGQWDEERYQAQIRLADLLRDGQRYDEALDANLAALKTFPRWPDAYFGLARTYYYLEDWPNVIHWSDIGRAMPPPERLLFVNPADFSYGWIIYYTNALYRTGQVEAALEWTRKALALAPRNQWHTSNLEYFSRVLAAPRVSLEFSRAPVYPTYAVIPVRDRHELTANLLKQLNLPPSRVVIIDNTSERPARELFADSARVLEHANRHIGEMWNRGLDDIAGRQEGPYNVAILNNDLEVTPPFLTGLANGLRVRPDHAISYPDHERRLPAGVCDAVGRMSGFAFMLKGELGLRADPQFVWWYGDNDLERRARQIGQVVCIGGLTVEHLEPNLATSQDPELQAIADADWRRYSAKWD